MGTSRYVEDAEWADILRLMRKENALAIKCALATGLRISDVLALKKSDIERATEGDGHIWVTEQKTQKRRRIYLGAQLRKELHGIYRSSCPYVWAHRTRRDAHRTREAVYKDLCRAADLLRLKGCVTPHSARKTYTVRYMDAGHTLLQAMRLLKHSSPSVTAVYAFADMQLEREKRRYGKRKR